MVRFLPAWEEADRPRLNRPDRQRAIGAGTHDKHAAATLLRMTLMWLRLYRTPEALGALFDVHKATVSRNGRRVLGVLRRISRDEFQWPNPPRRGKDLAQALTACPDLLAILDATEQPVQRPKDPERQRRFDSGKKRRYTIKAGLVVNEEGLIRAVTPPTPGSVHDIRHFRESGVLGGIPRTCCVVGDSAFTGLQHDLPRHSLAIAHKARRNHPLTLAQKVANQELSRLRMVVEHVFAAMKPFRALADRFRHTVEVHQDVFTVIAALESAWPPRWPDPPVSVGLPYPRADSPHSTTITQQV